jgi:hypothetical protein
VTRFFVPPSRAGSADAERAYGKLRELAEDCTGSAARGRRIEEIECRRDGRDCRLRVGESDAANGRTVAAIIQVGRDIYTIHYLDTTDKPQGPTMLQRTDVYSATDFQ